MAEPKQDALIAELIAACDRGEGFSSAPAPYTMLASPARLGALALKNRCLIAPTALIGSRFALTEETERFYLARADAGLLATGPLPGKAGDAMEILRWGRLNERLHSRGARILLQLVPDGSAPGELAYLAAAVPAACFDGVCLYARERDEGLLEAVRAIRARLGKAYPILVRASLSPAVAESGLAAPKGKPLPGMADRLVQLNALARAGADGFEISVGGAETPWLLNPATQLPPACFAEAARALSAHVRCLGLSAAVAAFGRIAEPGVAEALLRQGYCELVSLDGAGIDEPDWCRAALQGREAPLPRASVAPGRARIAVIGAGCKGLSYAIRAADAGCRVDLYEAAERPGGELRLFCSPVAREKQRLLARLLSQLERRPAIRLIAGTRADAAHMRKGGYDRIVFACAPAKLSSPPVPGWGEVPFVSAEELDMSRLDKRKTRHVAVLGGSAAACDIAWALQSKGLAKRVSLVAPELMPGEREADRAWFRQRFPLQGGALFSCCRVSRVRRGLLGLEDLQGGKRRVILCDLVVLAEKAPAPLRLYEEALREKLAPEIRIL